MVRRKSPPETPLEISPQKISCKILERRKKLMKKFYIIANSYLTL